MQNISPESPEARRRRFAHAAIKRPAEKSRFGAHAFEIVKRIAIGAYSDGFIHAGNLAYLALVSIFPFVIVAAAIARLLGQTEEGTDVIVALLQAMPQNVAQVLAKPITDVVAVHSHKLLWLGVAIGLWTTASFIETIRDIIRRAYGVQSTRPFWEYRLAAIGIIIASVMLAMMSFNLSILFTTFRELTLAHMREGNKLADLFALLRFAPALIMYGSFYMLFFVLTPKRYRGKGCIRWPGPMLVTIWWLATVELLPMALSSLGNYGLTYGSLAGVIIALIFFFIIGLGFVMGAELNAALAETPEERLRR